LLTDAYRVALLRAEARRGLTATPKQLPPKWFYDERGSELFEAITREPEYYLTRREREILNAHAGDIARMTKAATLVELGSGSSEKTRLLLDALRAERSLRRFMPFDVCLPAVAPGDHVRHVPLNQIRPCPLQPRKDFPEESLRELANSIQEQGIVQPLIVREQGQHFGLSADLAII
jgi:hypothetical protein